MSRLLLDTCALIWVMNDDPILDEAKRRIEAAAAASSIFLSPISAWEIGTLVAKGRLGLSMPPERWFEKALAAPGVGLAQMPPATLIASAFLPGSPPNDPADRIIIATARAENLTLVTRDARILDYGASGHVRALRC